MTNSVTFDPNDVLTISDGTIGANTITIHDASLYPGKITMNVDDIICDGFEFSNNQGDKVEITKEELESLLNLRNEEVQLREEHKTVKDAWRKYQMALKLARNSDSDK